MNRLRLWLPLLMGVLVVATGFAQVRASKASMAYGAIRVYTSKVDSFYVKDTTATGTAITAVTFKVGRQFSVVAPGGNLTPSLAAGDSVWYHVTFTPDSVGATVDTVFVSFAGGSIAVALTGTGSNNIRLLNAAGAAITSMSWLTDTLRPGVAKLDSFQVKNDAAYDITVTGMTNANPEFAFTPINFNIPAGTSVWVYTSYTGTAPGRDLDTLIVAHTDSAKASSPLRLNLAGRTTATLRFTRGGVTIDDLDWMAVHATNDGVRNGTTIPAVAIDSARLVLVSVVNNGRDTVRVDSVKFTSIHWENLVPFPYFHRPGAAYDRIFRFNYRPKAVSAPEHVDTMYLYSSDPNGSPIKLTIKGASTRRVHVVNTANAATLAFGNVSYGTTASQPLRILNKQDISLTVDSVALDEMNPKYSIIGGPVNLVVNAGAESQFQVQFSASDTAGGPTFRDTVLVYASGFQVAPIRVPVAGTVVTNIVFLPSGTTINVGDIPVQSTRDTTIKIFNRTSTNFTVNGLALTVNTAFAIQTNTASQPLNAGDSVVIRVRFAPQTGGLFRDTLVISNNIDSALVPTNPYKIALFGTGNTNAVLDASNFLTVDNASGIEGFSIMSADSSYEEFGPFWQNTNTLSFGGSHRRAPNLAGSANGSSARYTFTIDTTGNYLAYHYMQNSPNAGANYFVHFRKFGFGGVYDSLRYTLLDNNATGTIGTFFPLAMHNYSGVGKGSMTVTIGADERSSTFMRLDAVRLLKSRLAADIEFGRRDINFGPVRIPEEAPQVTVGDEYVRAYRLWNLGSDTLKVTNMQFFPTLTPVPWYFFKNYTPGQTLVIPPLTVDAGIESGGFVDVTVAFSPYQEGNARDSLVISSNDPQEPNAYIIMLGLGLNYNFILNASVGGTEPHFRAPAPPSVTTLPRYFELATGSWLSSTASPMFPITGANLSSRVNTGATTTLPHEAYFEFELPDLVYNVIPTFGDYILEHSGPVGSPNGHQNAFMKVAHTFGIPRDSARFSTLLQPIGWIQVGGALKTFKISPGGPITITASRNAADDVSGATNLLRLDLLRIRKVPTGALIGVDVATGTSVDFSNVNFRNPGGPTGQLNKREITVGSRGESQLVIASMRFRDGTKFSVANAPAGYPLYLRAINGEAKITLAFTPDRIATGYADTLEIVSNSVRDSLLLVRVVGNGIGGVFTVDDGGLVAERGSHPALDGLYLDGWDLTKMTRWQVETNSKPDSIAIGQTRRMLAMKYNRSGFFEWYPELPAPDPGGSDSMYVGVYATIPGGLTAAAPAAKYSVYPGAGGPRKDTVINQNGQVAGVRGVAEAFLGNYWFIRGGHDSYRDSVQGAGAGLFGHVRVSPDTASANFAGTDTLALVADAVVIRELEPPASIPVGVEDSEIPTEFALDQNFPNPFNPSTTIRFALPMRSGVELKIYDLLGREVRALLRGDQVAPGVHSVIWDGRNNVGQSVATGVYFYRINASGFTESRKMLLLK